jgi:hypothetical protein
MVKPGYGTHWPKLNPFTVTLPYSLGSFQAIDQSRSTFVGIPTACNPSIDRIQ